MAEQTVAILGYGRIGRSLTTIARTNGHTVAAFDVDPTKVAGQRPLAEVVEPASVIVVCVSSWNLAAALQSLVPVLKPGQVVGCVAKGIVAGKTIDSLFSELLPAAQPWALVYGPLLSDELDQGKPGVAVLASRWTEANAKISEVLAGAQIRCETTDLVAGVALAGALKNVYALGYGLVEALGWSLNQRGTYVAQALQEMVVIAEQLGISAQPIWGTAGVADFIATALSTGSKNHRVGAQLARGEAIAERSEGLVCLGELVPILSAESLPIFSGLVRVAVQHAPANEVFSTLFEQR